MHIFPILILLYIFLNCTYYFFLYMYQLDDEILAQDDSGNIMLFDVNKSIKSILAFNSMQVLLI